MVLCTDLELCGSFFKGSSQPGHLAIVVAMTSLKLAFEFKPVNVRMNQSHSSTLSFLIC